MAAFFDSRGVLCYISEWRLFLIAGVFFAIYPSSGFFDSRGVLCHISEWWRFSAIYVSGGVF